MVGRVVQTTCGHELLIEARLEVVSGAVSRSIVCDTQCGQRVDKVAWTMLPLPTPISRT